MLLCPPYRGPGKSVTGQLLQQLVGPGVYSLPHCAGVFQTKMLSSGRARPLSGPCEGDCIHMCEDARTDLRARADVLFLPLGLDSQSVFRWLVLVWKQNVLNMT